MTDLYGHPGRVDISLVLCLPRDAVSVPLSRRVASQLLRSVGFLAEDVDDIELALTEACSNVLRHSEAGNEYELRLEIAADQVVILVQDLGSGLPAGTLDRVEVGEGAEQGRGIPLMRALVDELSFHLVDGAAGSVVRMQRRLRTEPESPIAAVLLGAQAGPV